MADIRLDLGDYVSVSDIHDAIVEAEGGPRIGGRRGYTRSLTGNALETLSSEGGSYVYNIHKISMETGDIQYSLAFEIPREAAKWYLILEPELRASQAPTNSFVLSGEDITSKFAEKIKSDIK